MFRRVNLPLRSNRNIKKVYKEKLKETENLFKEKTPGLPLWKRIINPFQINDKALVVLVGVSSSILLAWKYFLKPHFDQFLDEELQKTQEVPKSFEEDSQPTEHKKPHVFKLKKEAKLE